jgi:succinyl-CoA synthetase alpha subunit/citrate synthase
MLVNKQAPFNSYVGIKSLEQIASKDDKVLVMNILGNESRKVTPVSHTYSGGNVVAGVQYGRPGVMKTPIGDIPVYGRLADAVEKHDFNTGVIYLPPSAVYHAVAELIHYNKKLEKIVIVTEKLSVKDQMQIRAIAQTNSIDVFGANSLGVADAWNHVRIGGGLGGDKPDELLIKGSIAIHSNSGNFSTTITEYLKTQGFGVTTLVSSGKDTIIQYPVAEFLYAAQNDPRTKAVVLYIEPGGFYEKSALDMIQEGKIKMEKPIIACITGHWKAKLSRAVGHAGALAGSNDDAASKEKWFEKYFNHSIFDPQNPDKVSEKGIFVNSIQHIPLAMKAVFDKRKMQSDFAPVGNLDLKPWFGNDFNFKLPAALQIPLTRALSPYDLEIDRVNKELGAVYLRQNMRNKSGVSFMNPKTHITELHGQKVTDLAKRLLEENIFFAISKQFPESSDISFINSILNYLAQVPEPYFALVKQAENNGATPNQSLLSALAITGNNNRMKTVEKYISGLIDLYGDLNLRDTSATVSWEKFAEKIKQFLILTEGEKLTSGQLTGLLERKKSNVFELAKYILSHFQIENSDDLIAGFVLFDLLFPALVKKKITKDTLRHSYTYFSIISMLIILSTTDFEKNKYVKDVISGKIDLTESFTATAFKAVFNYEPSATELKEFSTLAGVTLSNGPGTLSAKGGKESVSARNHISTAFAGFLTNTGLAHGGNGFEGIDFILRSFEGKNIVPDKKVSVITEAEKAAKVFAKQKKEAKAKGVSYRRIPGINHPVFKGKQVNIDPREAYIYEQFSQEGINNVFWDFYRELVQELYRQKITKNVYAVNIDAVIAAISLKLLWKPYQAGEVSRRDMQKIGFSLFLIGRTIGVAAEIDDHRNRGLDMDCRTPQSETGFVLS